MTTLTGKFIGGIKELGYSVRDMDTFKYFGGNYDSHLNYYKMATGDADLEYMPSPSDYCVCGKAIIHNCYIMNDDDVMMILGNTCIKKFMKHSGRTCEICDEPHRNRIVNRCHLCRIGKCDLCDKRIDQKYTKCYNCKFN